MDDDATLLARFQAGEREAGEALFERHFDAMYRFFEHKVAPSDVADMVQKTFIGCLEGVDRFRHESSVRTLLYAIARRQLYGHYRSRRRAPVFEEGVSSIEDLSPSPTSQIHHEEQGLLLTEALRRIPIELSVALELHYLEGLRGPEIARVLEIPEGTVRSRLRRAIEAARAQVELLAGSGFARAQARTSTLDTLSRWAEHPSAG